MNKRARTLTMFLIPSALLILMLISGFSSVAYAQPAEDTASGIISAMDAVNMPGMADTVKIILVLTVLTLAPSILILFTSFTRIVIVLSFTRSALGTQQMPPNQVLIGLALCLTLFTMSPVINDINENAYQPLVKGEITEAEAWDKGIQPLREFMMKQIYKKDMNLFLNLSNAETPEKPEDISTTALVSAFVTSEMKRGFQMGLFIYIPFIMIDMVVASTLMSMGMMMLPPVMISLPFKILLFVLVDGWNLVVKTLITSFQ